MEREPGDRESEEQELSAHVYHPSAFSKAVERREAITINAWHVDQIIAAILSCTSSIYEAIEAIQSEDGRRNKDALLNSARKSAEESYRLMEELTNDLIK